MEKVRTRFAPSPTGYMHIGNLRTALFEFLFARKNNGEFLLRIEDTDQARQIKDADKIIFSTLKKFQLTHDNKNIIYQSKRLDVYKKFALKLIEEKKAYYCFCTQDEIDIIREKQKIDKKPPGYGGIHRKCHKISPEEIKIKLEDSEPYVIRFKMLDDNNKPVANDLQSWQDEIHGKINVDQEYQDDFVIIKSDGFPTYNFAHVIDDHEMQITHMLRGEEFISSTIKHINVYKALNWDLPKYIHLPLLLNPDKSKLSKRRNDIAVEDYLQKGYLPAAILNFIALLGWNPGKGSTDELFNIPALIPESDYNLNKDEIKNLKECFDIKQINKSGAVFDIEKLDYLNGWYIRHLKLNKLIELCKPYLKNIKNENLIKKIVTIEQERLKKISDISENIDFFYKRIKYPREMLIWKKSDQNSALNNLVKLEDFLISFNQKDFDNEKILEEKLIKWIKENDYGVGDILWPMRVALSGQQNSPSPFEIAWVLGKDKTIRRINQAQQKLK